MISKKDQNQIVSWVEEIIPECLLESKFDPTVKEPGHSYGENIEELLATKLVSKYPNHFSLPVKTKGKGKQTRKMEDIIWKNSNSLMNIKLGHEKKDGQPNMVAFNRFFNKLHTDEIDSYYILIVNVIGKTIDNLTTEIYLFNLYDYLDYVNYNYGTGQVMLKEKQFFADYDSNKYFEFSKNEIMQKLKDIDNESFENHMNLKKKQHQKRQEIFNGYC